MSDRMHPKLPGSNHQPLLTGLVPKPPSWPSSFSCVHIGSPTIITWGVSIKISLRCQWKHLTPMLKIFHFLSFHSRSSQIPYGGHLFCALTFNSLTYFHLLNSLCFCYVCFLATCATRHIHTCTIDISEVWVSGWNPYRPYICTLITSIKYSIQYLLVNKTQREHLNGSYTCTQPSPRSQLSYISLNF